MTSPDRKKFIVMYLIPTAVMDDWKKIDPEKRKAEEEKLMGEWSAWTKDHAAMILDTNSAGKTKLVTSGGVSDFRNDIMLYSIVEAGSHEEASKAFENHPHLQIPQSSVQVMEIRPMSGM
ncbi:MAG TPA: hypothetical protein VIF61_12735 [Methylocystis sp.]|jgi:hypothetical protein